MKSVFQKGKVFNGPDGQGYTVTRDVQAYDFVLPSDLDPFGGAPVPEAGQPLPVWLCNQIWPSSFAVSYPEATE